MHRQTQKSVVTERDVEAGKGPIVHKYSSLFNATW